MKLRYGGRDRAFSDLLDELARRLGFEHVKSGIVNVTWTGFGTITVALPHGFRSAPRALAQAQSSVGVGAMDTTIAAVSATTVSITLIAAGAAPVAGTVTPVAWWAWL